ncbi:glycosyltransferase [Sphingomonas sp. BN140010]|uniref:Glycosyltransferase n=1 Tax=Sphingomonas arvum TaxID=2992113 RepID=A0ABT3JI98_9SPHN|nr:glycosyltransferase [Sphingomonas sp. BN140010]MCW3798764.1 glycosyltransferase [Sphingomonas sp. BN140010]
MFRILLVEPDLNENGALRVSMDRARRWSAMGADVRLLLVSGHYEGERASVPAELQAIVANKQVRSARWMTPNSIRQGWTAARNADIIVAGREIASGLLIGTLLSRLARRPLAVTVHSNVEAALQHHGTPRHRANVLACLRRARLLTPVAQGLVEGLLELGIDRERIRVVENGFEPALLKARAREEPAVVLPRGPNLLAVGRLSDQKGFDVLIKAHALALKHGAPAHQVSIAGEGPALAELSGLAAELGVSKSVSFLGFVQNPQTLMSQADLFVLPSRWEGFPLALCEAVLLGVPVIASDCVSGPREILEAGRFGDLVGVADEWGLASAIERHLREPDRLREMAAEGSTIVEQRFTADGAARNHLEALKRLASADR